MNEKPNIMFVDDSKVIVRAAYQFLSPYYNIIGLENGFLALAAIVQAQPDLIFLDIMMPRLNGYDTCLAIRNNPDFSDIPIIMLSSKDSPFDKARGKLMGCNDYLTKPFSSETLLDCVRKYLK